jgi:CTP synthase
MKCTGINPDMGLVEVIEAPGMKWYLGVQFHPEYNSTVLSPNPLFISFIKAVLDNRK